MEVKLSFQKVVAISRLKPFYLGEPGSYILAISSQSVRAPSIKTIGGIVAIIVRGIFEN